MSSPSIPKLKDIENLQQTIQTRWTNLHDHCPEKGVFRYQLSIERERIIHEGRCRFLLQLNEKRTTKRRKPEIMANITPAFDPIRFNFNKVDPVEILLEVSGERCLMSLLINNSPLTKYHSLIVPDRSQNLPQILTYNSLQASIDLLLHLEDRNYRVGYNSPGALASVNHLHLHLMYLTHNLYVEDAPLTALSNDIYRLDNQPARAYVFLLPPNASLENFTQKIFGLITVLVSMNVAHNLFLTWNGPRDTLRALIYPRQTPCENKEVSPFNVAFSELSGFVPLGDATYFERLDERQLGAFFREAQGSDESFYDQLDKVVQEG